MTKDLQVTNSQGGAAPQLDLPLGRVFQWPPSGPEVQQKALHDLMPLPVPNLTPAFINLSGPTAEDVTVDRIQRSYRVPLDWTNLLTKAFDYNKGTGFEHIRHSLEKAKNFELDADGNPTQKALQKYVSELHFGPGEKRRELIFNPWHVKAKENDGFEATDFYDTNAYLGMWKKKVDRVELPLDTICSVNVWDLYATDIAARYEQIKAEINATSVFVAKADELLAKAIMDNGLDNSYRTSLRRAMDMKVAYQEARARMRELQQKAESLGYKVDLEKGSLTLATTLGASFIPTHHAVWLEAVDELGVGLQVFRFNNARPARFRPSPDWQVKTFTFDEALNQSVGLKDGLFERQGNRYIAATGHRLDEVLAQLDPVELDPQFGTISIPVYDMGVNTGERLTHVITATRPHIGRMPIRLPELFIEEKYRMVLRWSGVAAGEVVESITLAPGEERTLVMERSSVVERETRTTATSSLDITREARSEMISELEAESRRSRDATHSSNWSASASGGGNFGVWNASGSASGGQTWNESTNEFARTLSKLTQKAASSLTARTRYEVSSMASYKATSTTRESTTINLKNINQGCALTLFLHQLTNRYAKELNLTELTVTVLPAAETLFASEFSLPRQFPLSDVTGVLKAMTPEALPVGYVSTKEEALNAYYLAVLAGLVDALCQYDEITMDDGSEAKTKLHDITKITKAADAIAEAERTFKHIILKEKNWLKEDASIDGPCAGLLMSTMPSPSTALEDYTNNLRQVELERRQAETEEILARARQLDALASSIAAQPPELIATVKRGRDLKSAVVSFVGKMPTGHWLLLINGVVRHTFEVRSATQLEYQLSFAADQEWLAPSKSSFGALLHPDSKLYVPFVV